jgi:methyltransferase FkbM-like protein
VVGACAGRNSVHALDPAAWTERVAVTTVDAYAAEQTIDHIDLLKVDTEGHDLRVLRGAERAFRAGAISAAQFEYNHRWIPARQYLKDAFDMLEPFRYRIGKLTPRGVEWYPGWDPELESFVEGNYLACTAPVARRLPAVRWWKEAAACTSD